MVIVIYFQKSKIDITPNTTKSPTMRLTRSQLAAIDQELLVFCLNEFLKLQYSFETLEEHVLTFALEKKFASLNVVDDINLENLVSSFKKTGPSCHYSKVY